MSLRSRISLPPGFRWLEEDDVRQPFKSDDDEMDRFTLADYFEWGRGPESASIVREVEGRIAAVVCITLAGDILEIDMLARNKLLPHPGTGAALVMMLEAEIAPVLGVQELRLESRPGLVDYYDNDLEFEEYSGEVKDVDWPEKLTPKRKRV
jgi:hypothetical protein